MEKNIRLADIYIKIYNKQPLLMEDLAFLARYDRECFEKTCHNLIYNMPEARDLMQPAPKKGIPNPPAADEAPPKVPASPAADEVPPKGSPSPATDEAPLQTSPPPEAAEEQPLQIHTLLDNLKKMEWQEMPVPDLDTDRVKNLLGSLYMELLFPHNDRYRYFNLEDGGQRSIFNKKV